MLQKTVTQETNGLLCYGKIVQTTVKYTLSYSKGPKMSIQKIRAVSH